MRMLCTIGSIGFFITLSASQSSQRTQVLTHASKRLLVFCENNLSSGSAYCRNGVDASRMQGADVNCCDSYGWTPLMWATLYGNCAAIEDLLRFGADGALESTVPRQIRNDKLGQTERYAHKTDAYAIANTPGIVYRVIVHQRGACTSWHHRSAKQLLQPFAAHYDNLQEKLAHSLSMPYEIRTCIADYLCPELPDVKRASEVEAEYSDEFHELRKTFKKLRILVPRPVISLMAAYLVKKTQDQGSCLLS